MILNIILETALEELKGQVNYLREDLNLKKQQIERLEIDISYMKQETDTEVIEKHGTEDLDNRVTDLSVYKTTFFSKNYSLLTINFFKNQ